MTTMTKPAKRPTTTKHAESPQVGELTWEAVRWAAEIYWPGLGAKIVKQIEQWNADLFDGKVAPAPVVLSRMSSVHGHWFPLLDPSANQRVGTEGPLVMQPIGYMPPPKLRSVSRNTLLRGVMYRLRTQGGRSGLKHNSPEWCEMIMRTHQRLVGKRIWASVEYEEREPAKDLGKGLIQPGEVWRVQDDDPETGQPSLTRAQIAGWPGTMMDLGHITAD